MPLCPPRVGATTPERVTGVGSGVSSVLEPDLHLTCALPVFSGAEGARTPAVSVTSPEGCDVEMKMIVVAVERMLSAEAGFSWDGR